MGDHTECSVDTGKVDEEGNPIYEMVPYTGFLQLKSCPVTFHVYAATSALCDVDDYFPIGCGLGKSVDEPFLLWGIAGTVCSEDYAFEPLCSEYLLYYFRLYAGEKGEDDNVTVVFVMRFELETRNELLYIACEELYVCSCLCQVGVVV